MKDLFPDLWDVIENDEATFIMKYGCNSKNKIIISQCIHQFLVMAMYHGISKENPDKLKVIADKSKLFNEFNQIFECSLDIYSRVSFDTPL